MSFDHPPHPPQGHQDHLDVDQWGYARVRGSQEYAIATPTETVTAPVRRGYGAVRVWRLWRVDTIRGGWKFDSGYLLLPMITDYPWVPGENVARNGQWHGFYGNNCLDHILGWGVVPAAVAERREKASALPGQLARDLLRLFPTYSPAANIADVLMGFRALTGDRGRDYHYAVGSILQYGRVVMGDYGSRSSHAVPEALILPYESKAWTRGVTIARDYGMKVVSLDTAVTMPTGLVSYQRPDKTRDARETREI